MNKKFTIVIIGRPNVGKSSLFNRLVGERKAIVHDVAGTTRDLVTVDVTKDGKSYTLIDTAGYFKSKEELTEKSIGKVKEAIQVADLILMVTDGKVSPTKEDDLVAEISRKSGKSVILTVNKIDNGKEAPKIEEYKKYGFKKIFPVSVIHNLGIGDFEEEILKEAPKSETRSETQKIKVAILGRPNVGKSSILNQLCGSEKAIVSHIPGTTRDVVSVDIQTDGEDIFISDTAGARKPGKIGRAFKKGEPVEKYSYLRTQKEIERSDIALIVIDASQRIAAQDLHIAGAAKESGKGIILVINKWDLVKETDQNEFLNRLRWEFNFMIWVPAIFVSAKTGRNIEEISKLIQKVAKNQKQEIATSKLNRILEDFILTNPPRGVKNMRPKMFFIAQTGNTPPTFTVTAKHHGFVHFAWRRALENELRRYFDFTGTPIKIEFRGK